MIEVLVSSVIPATVDRVWSVVRDFNAMPAWHPAIAQSRIEGGAASDAIGCVRNFSLKDGKKIREKLLSLSDLDHSFSYSILTADIPLENYRAGLALFPVTDSDQTFGIWTARFTCPKGMETDLEKTVSQGVFQTGFDALKSRFA
ncbi:MAG TPA: MxaD family protein [Rhodobacteraceae bacterium]|nr:MxaD family protein [Paracoccaceae bacterium]